MISLRFGFGIVIICILLSCNPKQQSVSLPIDEKELLDIMVDLTLAQAAVTNYPSNQKDSMRNVYKYQIEKIHRRSMVEIDSILNIIYTDAELNKTLQKKVLDSIKVLEESTKRVK